MRVRFAEWEEVDPGLEGADVVRRAVGEGPVRVARARFRREVVVSLHVRVYYERAGLRGDGDVQIREPELATLVRIIEKVWPLKVRQSFPMI